MDNGATSASGTRRFWKSKRIIVLLVVSLTLLGLRNGNSALLLNLATVEEVVYDDIATRGKATATVTTPPPFGHPSGGFHFDNVMLQGQFNVDLQTEYIVFWVQTWSKYFRHVKVVGPFSNETTTGLAKRGIAHAVGRKDNGYVSPYESLLWTMQEVKDDVDIQGVLYIHDDALLHLPSWTQGMHTFPTDTMICTNCQDFVNVLSGVLEDEKSGIPTMELLHRVSSKSDFLFYAFEEGRTTPTNTDQNHSVFVDPSHHDKRRYRNETLQLLTAKRFPNWPYWDDCLSQQRNMLGDPQSSLRQHRSHSSSKSSSLFPQWFQSDALFVPTQFSKWFIPIAQLHADHDVFLECAIPSIVYMVAQEIQKEFDAARKSSLGGGGNNVLMVPPVRSVSLCSSWDFPPKGSRGKLEMILNCWKQQQQGNSPQHGMYHPFKLSRRGTNHFATLLDRLQQPNVTLEVMEAVHNTSKWVPGSNLGPYRWKYSPKRQ